MNTKRILFSFAAVALLASCGNNQNPKPAGEEITKEVAAERYSKAMKGVSDGTTTVPEKFTAKVDMNLGRNGYESHLLYAVDPNPESLYTHAKVAASGKSDEGLNYSEQTELWLYVKESHGIAARLEKTPDVSEPTKKYYDVEDKATFKAIMASFQGVLEQLEIGLTGFLTQFDATAKGVFQTAQVPTALIGGDAQGSLPAGMVLDKDYAEAKYYSTGEGNLTMTLDLDLAAHLDTRTAACKGSGTVAIDQGLPQKIDLSYDLTVDGVTSTNATAVTFEWGKVELSYPDLSTYQRQSI